MDSYFSAFERIATGLHWPPDVWALLLQCKIHGKAQEAVSALLLEGILQYDSVKVAIMCAYDLVPEDLISGVLLVELKILHHFVS